VRKAAHDTQFTQDVAMMVCVVVFNETAFDGDACFRRLLLLHSR
jgi:hypothetical protein